MGSAEHVAICGGVFTMLSRRQPRVHYLVSSLVIFLVSRSPVLAVHPLALFFAPLLFMDGERRYPLRCPRSLSVHHALMRQLSIFTPNDRAL